MSEELNVMMKGKIMTYLNGKKLFVLSIACAALWPATGYADVARESGPYAGLALVGSTFSVESKGDNAEREDSKTSIGAYVGYKHYIQGGFFTAGEVFYYDTAKDKAFNNGDTIDVDGQYGLKAHLGYQWENGVSLYGMLGAVNFDYDVRINGTEKSDSSLGAMAGLGAAYQFNEELSVNMELSGVGDDDVTVGGTKRTVGDGAFRIGLTRNF